MKTLLHVGCASLNISDLKGFNNDKWAEIRFDIDKNRNPDIIGTIVDLSIVETGSVDAVYSAYNLDHIYPHEVPIALKEFFRVLKNDELLLSSAPTFKVFVKLLEKINYLMSSISLQLGQ